MPKTLVFHPGTDLNAARAVFPEGVFCGPRLGTRYQPGAWTIRTPASRFDIRHVLDRLPEGWLPELVVVAADTTADDLPTGLDAVPCPRVLVIGGAEEAPLPLERLIDYVLAESFGFVAGDGARHPLHWFARAGIGHVAWLPGLTSLPPGTDPAELAQRLHGWIFAGTLAEPHAVQGAPGAMTAGIDALRPQMRVSQVLAEMHHRAEMVEIVPFAPLDGILRADAQAMPRLSIARKPMGATHADTLPGDDWALWSDFAGPAPQRVAVIDDGLDDETLRLAASSCATLLCQSGVPALAEHLRGLGFEQDAQVEGLFFRRRVAPLAQALLTHGQAATAADLLRRAGADIPDAEAAVLADLAEALGDSALELAFRRRQAATQRGVPATLSALAAAARRAGEEVEAAIYDMEAIRAAGHSVSPPASGPQPPALAEYLERIAPQPRSAIGRRLNILLLTNLFPPQEMGGYGRQMWEYALELERRGHRLTVLSGNAPYLTRPDNDQHRLTQALIIRNLDLAGRYGDGGAVMKTDKEEIRTIYLHNFTVAAETCAVTRPDCVLLGNIDMLGAGPLFAATQAGKPVLHCLGLHKPGFPADLELSERLYRMLPASKWLAGDLRARGYRAHDDHVVYPGARTSFFHMHQPPTLDKLRIAFAGLIMPYKGVHTLVQALHFLKVNDVDFTCTMAGDTLEPKFVDIVRRFIDDHGLSDRVSLRGFLDRQGLRAMLADHNVLVFPSELDETFGIVPVEAMATGLPVVTTATGGNAEVVRNGVDGIWFEKGNVAALGNALLRLTDDPAGWARMSANALERAPVFGVPTQVDHIEKQMLEMIEALEA